MADRFPSLDEFDAGQTEPNNQPQEDTSDFLARERAALGEDANQFSTPGDNLTSTVADAASDDDDDLLGGGGAGGRGNYDSGPPGPPPPTNGDSLDFDAEADMMGDFEQSFPAMDTSNEGVGAGGSVTGTGLSGMPIRNVPDATTHYHDPSSEPEVLRDWREKRDAAISSRDERSSAKKRETVKAAQEAVDEFYENYNNRKEKQIAQTRKEAEEFLAGREDTTSGGTSWERIAKLVDLSGKGVGGGASGTSKARMREVLLDLRKDGDAPGAKGV